MKLADLWGPKCPRRSLRGVGAVSRRGKVTEQEIIRALLKDQHRPRIQDNFLWIFLYLVSLSLEGRNFIDVDVFVVPKL